MVLNEMIPSSKLKDLTGPSTISVIKLTNPHPEHDNPDQQKWDKKVSKTHPTDSITVIKPTDAHPELITCHPELIIHTNKKGTKVSKTHPTDSITVIKPTDAHPELPPRTDNPPPRTDNPDQQERDKKEAN